MAENHLSDFSVPAALSDISHPQLKPGEAVLHTTGPTPSIGLYYNDTKATEWQSCTCILTSMRVLLINPSTMLTIGLLLRKILQTSEKPGFLNFSHPKIRLHVIDPKFYMLSFREGGRDEFHQKLRSAMTVKTSWLESFSRRRRLTFLTTVSRALKTSKSWIQDCCKPTQQLKGYP